MWKNQIQRNQQQRDIIQEMGDITSTSGFLSDSENDMHW